MLLTIGLIFPIEDFMEFISIPLKKNVVFFFQT